MKIIKKKALVRRIEVGDQPLADNQAATAQPLADDQAATAQAEAKIAAYKEAAEKKEPNLTTGEMEIDKTIPMQLRLFLLVK